LVLFEVCSYDSNKDMKWFTLDRLQYSFFNRNMAVYTQYLLMLSLCTLEFVAFHLSTRTALMLISKQSAVSANQFSMAIILSSFGKVILLFMVIWDYGNLNPSFIVNLFVIASNFTGAYGF
jgi:hypothetical protein